MDIKKCIEHKVFKTIKKLFLKSDNNKYYLEKSFKAREKKFKDEKSKFEASFNKRKNKFETKLNTIINFKKSVDNLQNNLFDLVYIECDENYLNKVKVTIQEVNDSIKYSDIDSIRESVAKIEILNKEILKYLTLCKKKLRKKEAKSKIDKYEKSQTKNRYFSYGFLVVTLGLAIALAYYIFNNVLDSFNSDSLGENFKLILSLLVLLFLIGLAISFYDSILKLNQDIRKVLAINSFSKLLDEKQENFYIEKYLKSIIDDNN